jgi:hypothetical protein
MKKILLSMVALAASTMVANAGKVAFVAADNVYPADSADQVVVIPSGFDAKTYPITSDAVMLKSSGTSYITSASFRWPAYTSKSKVYGNVVFTPASGVSIKKITITGQTTKYSGKYSGFTNDGVKDVKEFEEATSEAVTVSSTSTSTTAGDTRPIFIEVEYEGTPAIAQPRISSANYDYIMPKGEKITITAAEGAKIYYTLDGKEPTTSSTEYTEPFALDETAYIRAIAVKDDKTSYVTMKGYVIVPAGVQIAKYDFTNVNTLTAPGHDVSSSSTEWGVIDETNYKITPENFTADKTKFTGTVGAGMDNTAPCIYLSNTFGGLTQYRAYKSSELTYEVTDDNYYLAGVVLVSSYNDCLGIANADSDTGIVDSDDYGTYSLASIYQIYSTPKRTNTALWLPKEGVQINSVKLKESTALTSTQFHHQFYILYAEKDNGGNTNAIENVAVDANAPVEFYNLQGVRVANPTNGIYVKRQGNTATKVLVK